MPRRLEPPACGVLDDTSTIPTFGARPTTSRWWPRSPSGRSRPRKSQTALPSPQATSSPIRCPRGPQRRPGVARALTAVSPGALRAIAGREARCDGPGDQVARRVVGLKLGNADRNRLAGLAGGQAFTDSGDALTRLLDRDV